MTNTAGWAIQFFLVALAALFAGPLLSKLPAAQTFPVTLFGLTGAQTIRLVIEEAGLVLLCLLSFRAFRLMPDNGRGFGFVRRLVLPMTMLFVWIATDKTLRVVGLSLIERVGRHRYTQVYTAGLMLSGMWISAAWLLNMDSLHRFFAMPSTPARRPHEAASAADDSPDGGEPEQSDEAASAGVPINTAGPPSTLGRYKILKEIGRGAMGVVYLGKDPTIQRFVAIKTMRLDQIDDADKLQEVKARFFREAESNGRLSHHNIVTVFDAGEEQDLGYIAMEVLEGTTLTHWSRKPNLLAPDKLTAILAAVAEALDYAHQQGVVHRDIKPANIMLTKDEVVKVMDFGIAKMATSSRTHTDIVLGTPTYMSPEQIAGKKVDGRSDIFSLGVVLFELLTGRPPFTSDNVSALLFAIAHSPHPALSALRPDLPVRMQDVVSRALQKDPVHRYRRAAEFAQALRSCATELAA
jgi:eukaryotic-like serine/threonine-protein kinase